MVDAKELHVYRLVEAREGGDGFKLSHLIRLIGCLCTMFERPIKGLREFG